MIFAGKCFSRNVV